VLLFELIALHHPFSEKRSVADMLAALIKGRDLDFWEWSAKGHAAGMPAELIHIVRRGMKRDPRERYQSVDELIAALSRVRDQRPPIQCQYTLIKAGLGIVDHGLAKRPRVTGLLVLAVFGLVALGLWSLVAMAFRP
jgi:hypothetical protein